jgi:hypothetical protein
VHILILIGDALALVALGKWPSRATLNHGALVPTLNKFWPPGDLVVDLSEIYHLIKVVRLKTSSSAQKTYTLQMNSVKCGGRIVA